MKKVISIALFGAGDRYAHYLSSFVLAHLNLFPIDEGWTLRVHVGVDIDLRWFRFLKDLSQRELIHLVHVGHDSLTRAMLWRLLPVFETEADYVFCRDLDACPMPRDRAACEEFMRSDCVVHTIHDCGVHFHIMGGLCGFHAPEFRRVTGFKTLGDFYDEARITNAQWGKHGTDQLALNSLLLRPGGPRLFEHRFAGRRGGVPGPGARPPGRYPCGGMSSPVPSIGVSKLTPELAQEADQLAKHLGASDYDHEAAQRFWAYRGDRAITEAILACEKATL